MEVTKTSQNQLIEHFYNVVATHLRVLGTWNLTVRKFPPGTIRGVIKQILDRFASNVNARPYSFDWGVEFEQLRDYETVDDF